MNLPTIFQNYEMKKNNNFLAWSLLVLLAIIWGTSFILIKKGLQVYSAGEVGALRIVFAGIFLLPVFIKNYNSISKKQWKLLFVAGLVGSFFPAFLFATAQTQINSSLAGMLNALTPIFALLMGVVFFKAKINGKMAGGLALGFAGTVYLMTLKDGSAFSGINVYALFVIAATILYGSNINLVKYYLSDVKAVSITGVSLVLVSVPSLLYLFLFSDFTVHVQQEGAMLALGYMLVLGVVGTAVALILFNHLIQITNPVFSSSVTYLIPIVALIWGFLDQEQIGLNHVVGMGVISFGVFLANKK